LNTLVYLQDKLFVVCVS